MNTKKLRLPTALLCCVLVALSACHRAAPEKTGTAGDEKSGAAAKAGESKDKEASEGVSLSPEQIEKIGVQTDAAKAVDYAEETAGYGTVIPHESIAQAVEGSRSLFRGVVRAFAESAECGVSQQHQRIYAAIRASTEHDVCIASRDESKCFTHGLRSSHAR